MDFWNWEFAAGEVTGDLYAVSDHGPLYGPVSWFAIKRDKDLNLILETSSPPNSTSSAIPIKAQTVFTATGKVTLESRCGALATASGVIPRSYLRSDRRDFSERSTRETSSIHVLDWQRKEPGQVRYIIEWVENMSTSFLWPHTDNVTSQGERRRRIHSPLGEIVMSTAIESGEYSRSCVHLVIAGVELVVGVSKAKPEHVSKPGFILYKGAPDENTRSKIRDCLSFCLGNFLVFLGDTSFDDEWMPVSFSAKSAHALVDEAPQLTHVQPAPLGQRYEFEVTPELLGLMATALFRIYDVYRLQSVLWSYWHALSAPVHMTAAHFGAAIEAVQKAFVKASGSTFQNKVVADETAWKELSKRISTCISEADLTPEEKKILTNKAANLNYPPQGVAMERLFAAIGLKIGALERDVWGNRNRAAHGGGTSDSDNNIRLVRENKVLRVMLNRILFAISGGSALYYDYYTIGRPTRLLADPIQDDRKLLA